MAPNPKEARLNLRLTKEDDEVIRLAAARAGESVSEFLTSSALQRAHAEAADQRSLVVDDETWDWFVEMLEHPVKPDPRLIDLFSRPSRIDRR